MLNYLKHTKIFKNFKYKNFFTLYVFNCIIAPYIDKQPIKKAFLLFLLEFNMSQQSLMSIFEEYQNVPKLRQCSQYVKDMTKTYVTDFLNKPTISNLLEIIDSDRSISNLFAEKIRSKLFSLELSQKKNAAVTLLDKPEVVSFEELKIGDIYVLCSEIQVFLDQNNSSYFNFNTLELTETLNMEEQAYNSNSEHPIIVIGKMELEQQDMENFLIF